MDAPTVVLPHHGADPAVYLTRAQTENGQAMAGTEHRRSLVLATRSLGAAQGP